MVKLAQFLSILHKLLWWVSVPAALICLQALMLLIGQPIIAPEAVNAASLVLLFAPSLALLIYPFIARRSARSWAIIRAICLPPLLLAGLVIWAFASGIPGPVNRVRTPDGEQFLLGVDPAPTDVVYSLWRAVDTYGLFWTRVPAELTYSEDGSLTSDPKLVLSHDSQRLTVRRGGRWTDCLASKPPYAPCPDAADHPASPSL
jgi:hypothetical protein